MNHLVSLPVLLPLFGAGLKPAIGGRLPRGQRLISVGVLTAVLGVAIALLVAADRDGPVVARMAGWPAPTGIVLVADRLSALMLVVSCAVTLGVLVYAIGQGRADEDEATPLSVFHPTYLILVAGVANAFLAGDLFNLYVGFEVLLAASYVLLTVGGTAARVRAGAGYVVVGLLSSAVFLSAIAMVYAATGTVNLAQLAVRLPEVDPGVQLVLESMLLIGFGVKAAVFPLSAWLPDSYPTAPAPVTAVFAGLLTKVGVYAIIRIQTLLFPDGRLRGLLLVVAAATMIVAILGAIVQSDLNRLLSFTLVSHIGYMVFGIALASAAALSGTVFYAVHHITVQTSLFLVVGLIERRGGSTDLGRLGGLARMSPALAVLFFVPAMNLGGIPPLSGFLGKWLLLRAGAEIGSSASYVLIGAAVGTSLLTLYAMARVWGQVFGGSPDTSGATAYSFAASLSGRDVVATSSVLPRAMTTATCALVAVSLAFTVLAGPLVALTDRVGTELVGRFAYIEAVPLPGGFVRGTDR
ncbi:Na+/H+ antiporter subunit D [Embleya sp. NPDC005575]|uniref:Na+/H+ antiporter subunit D n=1 Tax=Embleya sp. NPDC005575 TaxID=3156892 RepID=UPI0033BC7078